MNPNLIYGILFIFLFSKYFLIYFRNLYEICQKYIYFIKNIIEYGVHDIYIALDQDAKKDSIKLAKFLMDNGINVYRIDLKDEDPSKIGFKKFWKLVQWMEWIYRSKVQ